nr:ribonuclease H-like domain-containing protein [Tanacetum cinerariifolium]
FRFRINSKSSNKVYVIVVLDLSKVANPLYSLKDKYLFKSKDPQVVVAAAKLPILNPNEFDLWKMRIEQYFSMTDYSLWEVILNGDSPSPTRIVDGVVQIIAPTTAEQSDAVIYSFFASQSNSPQLDNEDLKQIDPDDLKEMDLKWQMNMFTMRARRFLKRTRRNLGLSSSSGSDNEVAPCSKACSKSYATLQTHYDNLTVEFRKSQGDVLSYKIGLESVEARLVVYQQNETVLEDDIKLLKLDVMLRDNALAELRKKFLKAEKERDKQVFDCEELHIHESDNSVPKNPENDRYTLGEGYHVVPPLYIGTFMPLKPFNDAPTASESVVNVFHVESSLNKPSKDMSKTYRPAAPIIKDWISDSEDETEIESVPKQKEPSFVPTSKHVTTPKETVKKVEHPKQAENLRTNNQKSRGHKQSWNRKACFVCRSLNPLIKDCDYCEKQMEQKHVWNNTMRVNHQNSVRMTRPYSNRNIVPTTVLMRSRLVSLNVARPVSTAVPQSIMKSPRLVKHVVNKAHSPIRKPINHRPATKNSNFNNKVTTVKVNKINVVQGTKG